MWIWEKIKKLTDRSVKHRPVKLAVKIKNIIIYQVDFIKIRIKLVEYIKEKKGLLNIIYFQLKNISTIVLTPVLKFKTIYVKAIQD